MAAIEPKNPLHLIAVPFLGTEEGEALLVDTATLRACWDNRRTLKGVTFTSLVQSSDAGAPQEARDGTNLEAFKAVLHEHGRDDDFIEAAVATLFLIDEARLHHDAENRKGSQTLSEGDILTTLTNEGATEEQLDLVEKAPLMRDGLRAYAKFAVNLRFPKNEDDLARTWADLGDDKTGWEGIRTESLSYDADSSWASVKDDVSRKEAGATEVEIKILKVEQVPGADEDLADPGGQRPLVVQAPLQSVVITIPAPPLPERFLTEVERQKAERREHEAQARVELVTLEQRSQYLVLLLEVAISIAFALPDDDVLTELKRLRPLIRRGAPFRRRVVDGVVYELNNPSWGQADSFFAQMINGGYPVRSMREDIGTPESDVAYLLKTIADRGFDPETVNVNLLREREEAERARLEAERRAEEARLEAERLAERLAEEARIEAERREAEKAATEAATKAAVKVAAPTPPPAGPPSL